MKKTYRYFLCFLILQFVIFIILIIGYQIPMYFLIAISLCILTCILIIFLSGQVQNYDKMKKLNSLHRRNQKMQETYYQDLKNSEATIAKIKQDINHKIKHFQLQHNDETLIKEYQYLCTIDYCNNSIIDAILYNKSLLANNSHIVTSINVQVPNQINLNPIDIISLYTNLLDNAIEGCILCPQEQRYIEVHSYVFQQNLMITVKNSKHPDIILHHKNNKSYKQGDHGLGLHIIEQICIKYQGSFDIKDKITEVEMTVVLAIPDDK